MEYGGIKISKYDEVFVKINANDKSIYSTVSDYFSFYADDYQFAPAYKNKMWDGKVRLFDYGRKLLPAGLAMEAIKCAKRYDYSCSITPDLVPPKIERDDIVDFVNSLNISGSNGDTIQLRDYQMNAVVHAIQNRRALVLSPTGSGKSLIIYAILRWYLNYEKEMPALLVVPTTSLVEQMFKDFADYSQNDSGFNHEEIIHLIYAGKEKESEKRIVITTWQSVYKLKNTWFAKFGAIIGDEAHLFTAASLNKVMHNLCNAWLRIGTTGTVNNTKCNIRVLVGHFGPIYTTTTTKDLIDNNTLSDLVIKCIVLKHPDDGTRPMLYHDEIDMLINDDRRNQHIVDLVKQSEGTTLVLFKHVNKHGKPLTDMIRKALAGTGRAVHFVAGEIATEDREEIREITEVENGTVIVASLGVFSTGINIKNLHNIVFAAPTKSQIKVLQSIGRGLRKAENGQGCIVYDIIDDITQGYATPNYAFKHGIERVKIYKEQGFEIEVTEKAI